MGHQKDIWDRTINNNTWATVQDVNGNNINIPNSDIYATHVENKIRNEHGLPLRTHYSPTPTGSGDERTRIIKRGTNESLFYNPNNQTNYLRLPNRQPGFIYR
jgi:hypothetical protein